YPLHAMNPAFVFEARVGAAPADKRDHLLDPPKSRVAETHRLQFPPAALGVARVHAVQFAREQRCFRAPGAGANFEEDVFLVVGVARGQELLYLLLDPLLLLLQCWEFRLGEFAQLRVVAVENRLVLRDLIQQLAILARTIRNLHKLRAFPGQAREFAIVGDGRGVLEFLLQVREALFDSFDFVEHLSTNPKRASDPETNRGGDHPPPIPFSRPPKGRGAPRGGSSNATSVRTCA